MNWRRVALLGVASLVVASSVAGVGLAVSGAPASLDGPPTDADRTGPDAPVDVESAANGTDRTDDDPASDEGRADGNGSAATVRLVSTTDRPTFAAAKKQVVRGESDLPAGTELVVVVVDREREYLLYDTATVDEEGVFRESVDLGGLPAGSSPTLIVYHDGTEVVNRSIDVAEPHEGTEIDAEWNWVYASPGYETFSGTTNRSPGTELTVEVHSVGDDRVHETRTVTVDEDGSFEASFDLDELSNGDNFRISVYHDGTRLDYVRGIVFE